MSQHPDPDEEVVMDFSLFRRQLIARLGADDVICEQDMAVLRAFDQPHQVLAQRTKVRKAFDSLMRNGASRRATDKAKDAGLAVIIGSKGNVDNVVPFGREPFTPEAA